MKSKEKILLIGGGGHCKSCIDVIEQEGKYDICGIVDVKANVGKMILGYSIIGTDEELPEIVEKHKNVLITVGQIKSASIRIKLYAELKKRNAIFPVITSPLAYVSKHAQIDEGTIIMHHAIINAEAKIGFNCMINTKSLIEHEAVIGNHCHVSTGAKVNGQVVVGDECFIGSGVVLANNIEIANNVIVPAGITVFKNIIKKGVYIKR